MADDDLFGWSGDEGVEFDCAYFFALRPSGVVAQKIGYIRESAIRMLRAQRPSRVMDDRLHLSLCAPKRVRRLRAPFDESLRRAGDEVASSAFRLGLKGFDCFNGRFDRPCLVLRSDEATSASVQLLKDTITEALFRHGFGWDASALAPHITLFYADGLAPPVEAVDTSIQWSVHEFVLIKSRVGHHEHETVGSWRLR